MTEPRDDQPGPEARRPREIPVDELRLRPGRDRTVSVDPGRAGWRYLTFQTQEAGPVPILIASGTEPIEMCVVVVSGSALEVAGPGGPWRIEGRRSPFDGLPSALWLPDGRDVEISAPGGASVAVATAPRSDRSGVSPNPILIPPSDVRVELRGSGRASREIHHIIEPAFAGDRLEVVEVLTPAGNWSSWPPHKHDVAAMPDEAKLEETYHYRFRDGDGWGIQRLYRPDGSRDAAWAVRDGDVVLVTDGYHPFAASPTGDAYYLNALAGDERTMACSFDPLLRDVPVPDAEVIDPRLPFAAA